jgi:cytochrome c oxidase assembly factor CtaG/cytochrome c2
VTLTIAAGAATPSAHGSHELASTALRRWTWEPVTIGLLLVSVVLYARGATMLWRRAGRGHGTTLWQTIAFFAGLATVGAALLSPIAWLSDVLFSVHMTQHEILMLISAPLLVFGQPLFVSLWALPSAWRTRLLGGVRQRAVVAAWRAITSPLAAFVLHAAALWIWHIPELYQAALDHEGIHALQHASFLLTAALFWWGMVHGRYGRSGYGLSVLYVFLTAVHSSVLGALMTIAPLPWYKEYVHAGAPWGIDALEDQQLAGLLMWVPSGLIFIVLGLALLAAWLGESDRRASLGRTAALREAARSRGIQLPLALALIVGLTTAACRSSAYEDAAMLTGGDPNRGAAAINRYGCGACHSIPQVRGARGTVGPPLDGIASRTYLAGQLPNTPANMSRWIQHPQQVEHGTAMPEMGVSETDARDIVAYLYTLR